MASILGFLLLESQPANAGKYGSNPQDAAAQSNPGANLCPARKAPAIKAIPSYKSPYL